MKKIFIIFCVIVSTITSVSSFALEADQYKLWERSEDLKDATEAVNTTINNLLTEYYVKRVKNKKVACEVVAARFLRYVRPNFFKDRLKSSLSDNPNVQLYPEKSNLFKDYPQSIYRGFTWPFIMPVAQSIKIDNVYLGTDKIDHFFSSGRRYYREYQRALKKGASHIEALIQALDYGSSFIEEKGILGYWSSGAFAFADIEANYNGMTLAIDMCQGTNPILKKNADATLSINRNIEMRDYVNPLWDEAFNNSFYFNYRWYGIRRIMLQKYCDLGKTKKIQNLWKSYQKNIKPSFHTDYLRGLILAGTIPDPRPQSLHEVCNYPDGMMEQVPFWNLKNNEGKRN